jgi:hypothetical protein
MKEITPEGYVLAVTCANAGCLPQVIVELCRWPLLYAPLALQLDRRPPASTFLP